MKFRHVTRTALLKTMAPLSFLILAFSLALIHSSKGAVDEPSAPYSIQSWRVEEGLPENSVRTMVQTIDGYMWLATPHGLTRFDGRQFKVFHRTEPDGLHLDQISRLYGDRSGRLWIGIGDQVVSFQNGIFNRHPMPEGTPRGDLAGFCEDASGRLYLLASHGFFQIVSGRVLSVPATGASEPGGGHRIAADLEGRLWMAWGNTLCRWDGEHWSPQARFPHIIASIFTGDAGSVWCGLNGSTVAHFEEGKPPRYFTVGDGNVFDIVRSRQGGMLFSVSSGLFHFSEGAFIALAAPDGNPIEEVLTLYQDREGNVWVGTDGHGLLLLRWKPLKTFSADEGLQHPRVTTVAEDPAGRIWLGTLGGGIDVLDNGAWRNSGFSKSLNIGSLCGTRDGSIWAGTIGRHLWRIKDGIPSIETRSRALAGRALIEDRRGGIWVAGDGIGVEFLQEDRVTRYDTGSGLFSDHTRCLAQDLANDIWVGTDRGLHRISEGQVQHFTTENGLGANQVQALLTGTDGALWIGTAGGGLSRYRDGRLTTLASPQGLLDDGVSQILEDGLGFLWLGTNRGLFRVRASDVDAVLDKRAARVYGRAFGKADGMRTLECSAGLQPNCLKAADGRLWFCTTDGIVVVDPKKIDINPLAPPVHIERLLADGIEIRDAERPSGNLASHFRQIPAPSQAPARPSPQPALRVPAGSRRLELHYLAISFSAPEGIRYRYRLDGYDRDWNEAGAARVASYTRVPPGNYIFRVQAANIDGVWSPAPAALALLVQSEVWQTWWFRAGAGMAVAALVFAVSYGPFHRRRQMHALRLRIARDLHDEVGSNLGTISLYNQLAQAKQLEERSPLSEFEEIDRVVQRTGQSLRDVIWFINPQFDTLDGMLQHMEDAATRLLVGKTVTFRCDSPLRARHLAVDFRRNVFFIFRELTHNILKHSQATHVAIAVSEKEKRLFVTVTDDGVGFDRQTGRRGHGLENMKQRAAELGGHLAIETQPGHGTTVRLEVPLT